MMSFYVHKHVTIAMIAELLKDLPVYITPEKRDGYSAEIGGSGELDGFELIKKQGWLYPEYCSTAMSECPDYDKAVCQSCEFAPPIDRDGQMCFKF